MTVEASYHPSLDEVSELTPRQLAERQFGEPANLDELMAVEQSGYMPLQAEEISNGELRIMWQFITRHIKEYDGSAIAGQLIDEDIQQVEAYVLDIDRSQGSDRYVAGELRAQWMMKRGRDRI